MRRDKMPTFVLAAAIVVAALIFAGVPLASLALPLVLLACPLMMIFMMRGMSHGGDQARHESVPEHEVNAHEPRKDAVR